MQGDVFGLNRVYDIQTENIRTGLDLSIPGLAYGYYTGAWPGSGCTIERLDFSSEVCNTLTSNLPYGVHDLVGIPSRSYGYFCGGFIGPTYTCTISRLDFSNETISNPVNLPTARGGSFSTQNIYYGYVVGDWGGSCTINRLDFASETISNLSGGIQRAFGGDGSIQNNSYGYFAGGYSNPTMDALVCTISRLDFSNEVMSAPTSFSEVRSYSSAISNNSYGYFGGGYTPTIDICTITRLTFSTETTSVISASLGEINYGSAATGNNSYGYFGAGRSSGNGSPDFRSNFKRLDFSTESISTPPAKMSIVRVHLSALSVNRPGITKLTPRYINWSESATTGYYGGGYSGPTVTNTIDRLEFSTETRTTPSAKLFNPNMGGAATQTSSYGYFGGGGKTNSYPDYLSTIDRLDFSTDTNINPSSKLTESRNAIASVFSNSYGYYISGGSWTCKIDRLDFSNETVISNPSLSLPIGRRWLRATSSENYGYISGGYTPTASTPELEISNIDRLDFSSDTCLLLSTRLLKARTEYATTSNRFYGYFGGGYNTISLRLSSIERLDFSIETVNRISNFPNELSGMSATSSNSYGYFGGGYVPPTSTAVSKINRLDFTTETITTPSTILSNNTRYHMGVSGGAGTRRVGKATYGYFGAGSSASCSTVDRLDFSTETVAPSSVITKISTDKEDDTMTISSNYAGYFVGGWKSPNNAVSTIDRLDFSSETNLTLSSRLSQDRGSGASISNSSYGYLIGGYATYSPFVPRCTIDRFDFSTETANNPGKNLSTAVGYLCGLQNSNYGYSIGGQLPPDNYVCTISRLDFSTETISNPGKYTNTSRANHIGSSNNSYGYLHGGYGGSPTFYICTIERLDFSTELVSNLPSKTSVVRADLGSASNNLYGYFGAGANFSSPITSYSTIDRLDFASETVTVPSQKLTVSRWGVRGFANSQ